MRNYRVVAGFIILGWAARVGAQAVPAESPEADPIPPLRPPHPAIGPDFWDLHRGEVYLGAAAFLALVVLCFWWFRRARLPEIVSPALAAQQSLTALRGQPEEPALLSRVSQVLKYYLVGALKLPRAEMTTREVVAVIEAAPVLGAATAHDFIEFFRQSDFRKFAPSAPVTGAAPGGVIEHALGMVARAEKSLAAAAEAEKGATHTQHANHATDPTAKGSVDLPS
jgi:hypothetical protein